MTSLELKKLLIHRIAEINDVSFLEAKKTIFNTETNSDIFLLNPEQKNEIEESKTDFGKGLYIDHTELENEVEKWLN